MCIAYVYCACRNRWCVIERWQALVNQYDPLYLGNGPGNVRCSAPTMAGMRTFLVICEPLATLSGVTGKMLIM